MPCGSIVAKWLLTVLALFADVWVEKMTHTHVHSTKMDTPTLTSSTHTYQQIHARKHTHRQKTGTSEHLNIWTSDMMFQFQLQCFLMENSVENLMLQCLSKREHDSWLFCLFSFTCIYLLYMCFSLTSLTWTSKGLREYDCQGTEHTQKEHNFSCTASLLHFSLFIIYTSACDICAHMYVSFTAWWLSLWPHPHAHNLFCLGSHCVSIWVHLELCHVTYSLLNAAFVFASGWTLLRQALDLTWAMFFGTPPWLILTELWIALQQTRVVFFVQRKWRKEVFFFYLANSTFCVCCTTNYKYTEYIYILFVTCV